MAFELRDGGLFVEHSVCDDAAAVCDYLRGLARLFPPDVPIRWKRGDDVGAIPRD